MLNCPSYFQMTRWKMTKVLLQPVAPKWGKGWGVATLPPVFWRGVLWGGGGVELPLILRDFFLIDHICYYVQVISIAIHGGGGGGWLPLN